MDFRTLLEKTKIISIFPGRLERQDLFAINRPLDDTYTCDEESLRSLFINLITHFNGKCRNIVSSCNRLRSGIRAGKLASKNKEYINCSQVHPLDISTAVFLCCNPVARQDLVLHFWGCRLAFPFVVQVDGRTYPELYFWPMRTVVVHHYNYERYESVEKPITQYEVKIVSIIRFQKLEESKSLIFNRILARSEKVHSFFFHHDCEGSIPTKSSVCKGLIEAIPHFRSETGPAVYFNLRGNVEKYPAQRQLLCSISNIILIMCRTGDIRKIQQLATICYQGKICKMLVVLFTDLGNDKNSVAKYRDLDTFSDDLPLEAHLIPFRKMKSPDIVKLVSCKIDSVSEVVKFSDILDIAKNLNINVDENDMEDHLERAEHTSDQILKEYIEHGKTGIFPAQGKNYMNWATVDKELYKLKKWDKVENVKRYRECLEKLKRECRRKQYETISVSGTKSVSAIINLTSSNSASENETILRYLHISFENATRLSLSKMYSDFKQLFNQIKLNESNESFHYEVANLDKRMNQNVLNISDIVREMGQMYEAIDAMNDDRPSVAVTSTVPVGKIYRYGIEKLHLGLLKEKLPKSAVNLLLLGYPVELMDGRSNSVPIHWIQRVLLELQKHLGNISVKIISVLGTQSTGKSTLLNVMFGSQFAVGPGRCTRGVCMYLVKVSDEMKHVCLSDYFLIIDTEGLYSSFISPEQIEERDNTERELATFVIGLSNVTIVNIMGENMSYLKDILPITVHAFLRMDLVGLRPKCRLLHHNVDRRNEMSLLEQFQSLQNTLDQYTEAACKLEHERVRRFGDIIHFDITKSIDYFPPLFDSDLVGCISNAYSREAMELKNTLTMDKSFFTLDDARLHIGYLWNAIRTDNFVYNFRNTIETEAQSQLDTNTCRAQWNMRQEVQSVQSQFEAEIENCNESEELDAIGVKYKRDAIELITHGVTYNSHKIDDINMPKLLAQAVQKFKFASIKTFEIAMNEYKQSCLSFFKRVIDLKKYEVDMLYGNHCFVLQIDHFLNNNLKLETETVSHPKGNTTEQMLFEQWIKQTFTKERTLANQDLEEHATNAIYRYFPMHRAKVDKVLCARHIREHCIKTFSISDHYWSTHMQCFVTKEQDHVKKILEDMILCKEALIADIKSRNKFYQADIFNALVLDVRNHPLLFRGILHIKPMFEIDLAISLCGELIHNLEEMETDQIVISDRLMKLAEQYFFSKCREIKGFQTSTNEAVEDISDILLHETEKYMLRNISYHLAVNFKEEFPYLQSKHGILCYVMIQMFDEDDCLPIYLRSPDAGIRCCLSALFDSYTGIASTNKNSKLHRFLEEYVNLTLQSLVRKLIDGIESRGKCPPNSPATVMKQCIDIIVSSLDSFVPVNDIRKFQEDTIEELDAYKVFQKLVARLKQNNATTKIVKSLKYSVFENHYDRIRYETVLIISESVMGCAEKCPCCGELCCIGQKGHLERHKTVMHRPTGFRKILQGSAMDSATTCWDEVNHISVVEGKTVNLIDTAVERWLIPVDVEVENNSFWKYMFATRIRDLASRQNIEENVEIPDSWKTLTKAEELRKLNELMNRIIQK